MPPPMHIVTTTYLAPRRLPSISAWPVHARAAHAVGVADRDRAAVDVELLHRDAELVAAVEHLHGERLVQLPQADVVDLQAVALQAARNGEDRADAHLVGLAAGDREAAEDAQRLQAALAASASHHEHAGRGAVGELAGIAGGDALVGARAPAAAWRGLPAWCRRGCPRPWSSVTVFLVTSLVSLFSTSHRRGHRHDLVVELARPAARRPCAAGSSARTRPGPRG